MIDIHSHIIPSIDDGAKNIKVTLDMLKRAEKDGTKKIIATPHYCEGYGETPILEVKKLVEQFKTLAKDEGINLDIYAGQEIYFNENMINDYKEGNIGTINDSRYMLIEFPMRRFDEEIFDVLYELQVRNIIPVIAHPERYRPIMNKPSIINKFIEEEYLFQLNAGSLQGMFGADVKKTAELLVSNGIYNFIGSDAHNDEKRCTGISDAINIANKKSKISAELFRESSKRMLNNEDVEFIGDKIREKKGIFSFIK